MDYVHAGIRRSAAVLAIAAAVGLPQALAAQGAAPVNQYGNPLKLAPRPTTAAITEADLKTRIYTFADDSMMGRQSGREGNRKGTDYIARELQRLGVEPVGENGTYFQALPFVVRKYSDRSTLTVGGRALRWLTDFVAIPGSAAPRPIRNVEVIYGGISGDTTNLITREQAAGKLVVLSPPQRAVMRGGRQGNQWMMRFVDAAAVATVDLDGLTPNQRAFINNPPGRFTDPAQPAPPSGPATLRLTREAAGTLFGGRFDGLTLGMTAAGRVSANLDFQQTPVPEFARNVIGVIRGSDPALRGQYVAIGAHNDHVGFNAASVDHDSARAYATAEMIKRIEVGLRDLTPEERAQIRVNLDSIRRVNPIRRDSINNGADDDGSGSMAVLEIAEAIARMETKPRRSIIFVWHTAEEAGLLGARWFTDHPTVPRDSIVAQVNIDMIGRGRADDIVGGGPDYVGIVGASMLSTELGQAVEAVNAKQQPPLKFDDRFDRPTDWPGYNNIYGRSDHAMYARYNIPIVFFFTGLHADYHRPTDEAQYLDYPHYTRITRYINDLVLEIANRDKRLVVDKATTRTN